MSRDERYPPIAYAPPARPSDPRRFPVEVFDLRDRWEEWLPYLRREKKIRTNWRRRPVMRDPATITHLVGHQMVVTYHREGLAFAERAAKAAYHITVSDDGGEVALLKPWPVYANHANELNGPSVGLGIEGGHPGIEARRTRKHTIVTPGLERGICVAMEQAREELPSLTTFAAHRQSSEDRRGDPGELLYICMADHARDLGLDVDMTTTWGDGSPIPAIWGGAGAY